MSDNAYSWGPQKPPSPLRPILRGGNTGGGGGVEAKTGWNQGRKFSFCSFPGSLGWLSFNKD